MNSIDLNLIPVHDSQVRGVITPSFNNNSIDFNILINDIINSSNDILKYNITNINFGINNITSIGTILLENNIVHTSLFSITYSAENKLYCLTINGHFLGKIIFNGKLNINVSNYINNPVNLYSSPNIIPQSGNTSRDICNEVKYLNTLSNKILSNYLK